MVYLKEHVPVHKTASRILEILICNQLALIKDELLCHWDCGLLYFQERAAKNTMFLFVKIPQVPLRFSYKGSKDKNLTDVHEFYFLLPPLEYHNQTWTWLDLLLAIKNDSKKVLISQVSQLFNILTVGNVTISSWCLKLMFWRKN